MVAQNEVVLAALAATASMLYVAVGVLQARRKVSDLARPALHGFVAYWFGLAMLGLATVFFTFSANMESLAAVRAVIYTFFAVIVVLCAGLVHYLLFVYTGRPNVRWIAYGFYAFIFLYSGWLIEAHQPHVALGHLGTPQEGEVIFHLHDEPHPLAGAFFSLGLVLPLLGSAIAYALLFFRTTDVTARYRIAMVSGGFVLWFSFSTITTLVGLATGESEQGFVTQVVSQVLGVLAAVLTLLAYDPPRFVQTRLGLRDLSDDHSAGRPDRITSWEHPRP